MDDQRRKQRIVEIVSDLLRAAVLHQQIQDLRRKGGLSFHHIEEFIDDAGHSILYRLKANCHALFRNNDDQTCDDEERLLDLAVGSIFHEAMKLRENLYQLETYRPRYVALRQKKIPFRKNLFHRFERIVLRAEQGVREGLADIKALFEDTLDQLLDLMRRYGDNDLLVRFLLSHRKLFIKVYGRKKFEELFTSMFKNGLFQGYWVGAMSYLHSGYYDMASQLFAKGISLAPGDERLQFLYRYARGLDAYYSNNYDRALWFFASLLRLPQRFKGKRAYLNHAAGICRDIATETLAEQKRRTAQRARTVARRLQTSQRKGTVPETLLKSNGVSHANL